MVIADLFSRQSKPWQHITHTLVEQVHEIAAKSFNKMISEICDANTRSRLMSGLIQPALSQLRKNVRDKVDELMKPHLSIHPITYNEEIKVGVQKIQARRHSNHFDELSQTLCGATEHTAKEAQSYTVILKSILRGLKKGTQPNVEEDTASLAADVAASYYEVRKAPLVLNNLLLT